MRKLIFFIFTFFHYFHQAFSTHQHRLEQLLNDSLIYETWDLRMVKGVMKRQNLKMSKYHNPKNSWHTCYQAICQGNGCRIENDVVRFCYPAIIITGKVTFQA